MKIIMFLLLHPILMINLIANRKIQSANYQRPATNINNIDTCKSKYLDFVLNSGNSLTSYYLNLAVKDKRDKTFDVVVISMDLYLILKEEQNLEKEKCVQLVKNSIIENKPINLTKSINEYGVFIICTEDKKVKQIAKKGQDYFMKYYFVGGIDKAAGEKTNHGAVIKQLIAWSIPVRFIEGIYHPYPDRVKCQ